jgi:hypothetical protein
MPTTGKRKKIAVDTPYYSRGRRLSEKAPVMPKSVTEAPELLDDIGHTRSCPSCRDSGLLPSRILLAAQRELRPPDTFCACDARILGRHRAWRALAWELWRQKHTGSWYPHEWLVSTSARFTTLRQAQGLPTDEDGAVDGGGVGGAEVVRKVRGRWEVHRWVEGIEEGGAFVGGGGAGFVGIG